MAELFDIDHETGDLSQYDSTVTDGGDLSVEAAAALASTSYGLQCVVDDTNRLYGLMNQLDTGTGKFRARFYFDKNTLAVPNATYFNIFLWHATGASNYIFRLSFRHTAAGDPRFYFQPYNDGGVIASINKAITGIHYVEIYIVQASDAVSADGSVEWWIDGVSQNSWANVDNYDVFDTADYIRFGIATRPNVGSSGICYFDQLYANDDGSEIGAYTPPPSGRQSRSVFKIEGPDRLRAPWRKRIY